MVTDRQRIEAAMPKYQIGTEIGRGAWGVVVEAEHRQLGRPVAIKILSSHFATDPSVRRRFATEARLLASLDHPHIVPIFDYLDDDGVCLLVMELCPQGTVWHRFQTRGIRPDAACAITLATCSALHYAHGKGILHRDIKPENLLFNSAGALRVTDFGIAKVVGGAATAATQTGEILGTPSYMAPEQVAAGELTPATDVYAVGTVLYELFSGRLPFFDDGNLMAVLYRHVHEQPKPLAEVAPNLPPALAGAVMRALATDPTERYPGADDFAVALADAALSSWGPGWVAATGLDVVPSRRVAPRISGGATMSGDQVVAPHLPHGDGRPSAPTTAPQPAPPEQPAGPAQPTGPEQPAGPAQPTGPQQPAVHGSPSPVAPAANLFRIPPPPGLAPQPSPGYRPEPPPGLAPQPSPGYPPEPPPRPAGYPPEPPPRSAGRRRGLRPLVVSGALAAVIAAAVIVVLVSRSGRGGPQAGTTTTGSAPQITAASVAPVTTVATPGPLLFMDDFSNPKSGWGPDTGQSPAVATAGYQADGYHVKVLKPMAVSTTFSVGSPQRTKVSSVAMQVDAAFVAAAPADGVGVRCDQGGRSGLRYTFQIFDNGSWNIMAIGAKTTILKSGTDPIVHTGDATNTILGQCRETAKGVTALLMSVNGKLLGSVTDVEAPGPYLWHGALTAYRSAPSPGTEIRFNHYRLYQPPA